jgi:prepilin-type N-terminal cleavage/methylation domain-containing protein
MRSPAHIATVPPAVGSEPPRRDVRPARGARRRGRAGFTLMELLLAAALGAVLVTATATMTGSFGQTVAQLETDSVDSYEVALARVTRDVRYAWWVDVPSRDRLLVADTGNAVTEYFRVGNSLLVRRPDGQEGAVITGLSAMNFEAEEQQRLREGGATTISRRLDGLSPPASLSSAIELNSGNSLAIAFEVPSNAGPLTVDGVDDRVLTYLPNRLDLRLGRTNALGFLHVEIHTARGPGDARQRVGSTPLASFNITTTALPLGTVLLAPATMSIAIPALATRLRPGTAYTMVLSPASGAKILVGRWLSLSGAVKSVVFRASSSVAFLDQLFVVPFGIYGDVSVTTTTATDVVSQVRVSLSASDGTVHLGSACVTSQVLADDPWLGVIPYESPALP